MSPVIGIRMLLSVALLVLLSGGCGLVSSFQPHSDLHPSVLLSADAHRDHTAISEFRLVNRRKLFDCSHRSPYIDIHVTAGKIPSEAYLTVNVSGVLFPSDDDWVAMMSPSDAK